MFSASVLPTAESRTFFATPEFITFLATVELAALLTADLITFLLVWNWQLSQVHQKFQNLLLLV